MIELSEWNSIDQKKFEFKDYYCAFLDILGYKEKAKLFFSNQFNLYGRIMRAMVSAGVEDNPLESPDGIITRIFSDSIILSIKKSDTALSMLLNYVGQLTAFFSYEGLFLRGGISIGKYFEDIKPYSNYSFVASEGIINSYLLEKEAVYPMVSVDEEIISSCPDDFWKGLIILSNAKLMFNYARYIIKERANNQNDVIKELDELIGIRNKFDDKGIVKKYDWIINYYLWYINQCHLEFGQFEMIAFSKFDYERKDMYQFEYIE